MPAPMEAHDAISRRTGEPMRCPTCGSRLVEVERSDVLIDACPSCRGVWLDRGELDKILVRERQMSSGDPDADFLAEVEGRRRPAPRENDHDREHLGGVRKRKRRGMLEDLLDFG
jgi:Zn-finger nucleic acid-binding protein